MSSLPKRKYRLYVDEVGNSDLAASDDPNHRYLSLTGVAMDLDHVARQAHPSVEALKSRHFKSHPDEPLILHRKQLINREPPFHALRDPETERAFNTELLALLDRLECTVFTVVIDKREHRDRYKVWRFDPYHYCLMVLVERYVRWLAEVGAVGDVMAESRGKREDLRLKESFSRVYASGSEWISAEQVHERLTSCQLKVKPKAANVTGLQLADLIAHPSCAHMRAQREGRALSATFGAQIVDILVRLKYRRSPSGVIERWGTKWLP
jgi:hypothetical protein